ncbi:MAG: insulinase family protein [Acidaminococcaceae bacterium]|nr:insulinase family protein [Acidaminococcaceae bacterium]
MLHRFYQNCDKEHNTVETGKQYSGFRVCKIEFIKEVNSTAYLMEHVVSGARLFYLANEDDNKVFTIGFRTPPADDTGVPHILEHSVLCGSRKYHLKEPFVELVKGSLNTFLNAMTYPDKTVYPVASRNDKDFHNLMDVYLDAVFYPLIYDNKFTLKQEGWHYELENAGDPLQYNGVVYNEMKGVYSSPDSYLEYYGKKILFPDTTYRFESGGLPAAIPGLTQEDFIRFHKTYYSPENSYIYLYGDMDIEATLAHLDSYLKEFPKTGQVHSEIPLQQPLAKTAEYDGTYPVPDDAPTEAMTYHEVQIVAGDMRDQKTIMALRLLENVLLESEGAPLRRALLDAGVAKDISGSMSGSMLQNIFSVRASGSEPGQKDAFVKALYHNLQKISMEGIDKELLEAALNSAEFKLREADFGTYPKGLIYGLSVLDSWIYDIDPVSSLQYEPLLKELRDAVNTNYYETLIETNLLDNTHRVILTLTPEPGKEEREQRELAEKLAALKEKMDGSELERYAAECAELHQRQAKPDSEEDLASIPLLERKDIKRETEKLLTEKEQVDGGTLLYQALPTNKVTYLNWYFDMSGISPELLPYCNLLSDVLGKLNTEEYSYADLAKYTDMYTGGISFQMEALSKHNDCNDYTVKFSLAAKCLTAKLPELFKILKAMTLHTQFEDKNRLKELIDQVKTDWDNSFFAKGQNVAAVRLASYFSAKARVTEQDYYSYYQFVKQLAENFEKEADGIIAKLQQLLPVFFNKAQYLLSYSCDAADRAEVRRMALEFAEILPAGSGASGKEAKALPLPEKNEAIVTPGKVQYVLAGGDYHKHGYIYSGSMLVLTTMLRYEYLWTKIRVQGGAYGANAVFDRNGVMYFSTYRDPQLNNSLEAFRTLPEWLDNLELTDREMTKYVIGTMSGVDVPLTNSLKVSRAAMQELLAVSDADRQKTRDEILDVSLADVKALAKMIREVLADNYICVVGGQQAIEENKDEFNKILKQ